MTPLSRDRCHESGVATPDPAEDRHNDADAKSSSTPSISTTELRLPPMTTRADSHRSDANTLTARTLVNVRSEPSTGADILGELDEGDTAISQRADRIR